MDGNKEKNPADLQIKLSELYFIKFEEAEKIINKAALMTDEGFIELFKLLEEAKKKQDAFILDLVRNDPKFLEGLKQNLETKFKGTTDKLTILEQKNSEQILEKLNDA